MFKHFEQGNYRGKVLVCVVDEQVSAEWIGDPPLLPLIAGQDVREDPPLELRSFPTGTSQEGMHSKKLSTYDSTKEF